MKKISLLLISLLGASLSLHAMMPVEGILGERSEQPNILSAQQERLRAFTGLDATPDGVGGGGVQRGDLGNLSLEEQPEDSLIPQQEKISTKTDSAHEAPSKANPRLAAAAEEENNANESALRLDDFKRALANNPTADRFVLNEDAESGMISIEPRAAGTSKYAIKQNKVENEIIIEALREALLKEDEHSAATVDSFFDATGSSGNIVLSAERLGEILQRASLPFVLDMNVPLVIEDFIRGALEYNAKAVEARAQGKTDEGRSWNNASDACEKAAFAEKQALVAKQSGNEGLAAKWREVAGLRKQSSKAFTKAAEASAQEKIDEANSWYSAGRGLYFSAWAQGKAIEAEQSGKEELAAKWEEVAKLRKQSIELYTKAAEVHQKEKTEEGLSWHNAGSAFYNAAEAQEQALAAEQSEKRELAAKWREVGALRERSNEPYTKAAEAYQKEKTNEGNSWNNAGLALYWSAEAEQKAIKAEQSGNKALAAKWHEIARLWKRSSEAYTKAAQARVQGKTEEGQSWHNAGSAFYRGAKARESDNLTEVAEEKEKAKEAITRAEGLVGERREGANRGAVEAERIME